MTTRRTVRIDQGLHQRLEDYTKAANVSSSDVIRDALSEYLDAHDRQRESIADELRRTGHLGRFELGVGDLATNRKHMEGFGE